MNLGDGLKLETELLDGKTKLILSPFERKSKISQKMGSKTKIVKCALRTKQSGHFIKSTQNSYIRSGKLAQNKTIDPETSQAKGEKHRLTFSPAKDLCKLYLDKDYLHIQDKISPATLNIQRTRNTANTSLVAKPQSCKKPMTAENMKGGLVCLTQDQLQQILMSVTQGNRPVSQPGDVREEETDQYSLNISNIPNEAKDENTVGLLQKVEGVSAILHGDGNQEACKQSEQKLDVENEWRPAGIFSTLGERERDRSLLEAKKAQWRKELDEQVALKKKEKEASEKWNNQWKKSDSNEALWEKCQDFDKSRVSADSSNILSPSPNQVTVVQADTHSLLRDGQNVEEAALPKHPFCAMQQQQKKWLEELNKQIEGDQQRKIEEKMISSKGEEHDRWAMHFDSLKSYPGSQSRLSSRSTHRPPEYLSVSPGTPELADVNSVCTPVTGSQADPSKEAHVEKPHRDVAMRNTQKTNFLRSMTALLDPAEIEERDRRRQKQLEHQKAITAQVEERRRKKQLEEEQRKKEELLEELRLAREREEMQKQYEEDVLRQKQKEEIMTLKTNALFQTMQRAQELAQRLKQEQKIRELAQKGHDTSRLTKNLGVDTKQLECNTATSSISNLRHNLDGVGATANTGVSPATSPKKDTAVQTEDLTTRIFTKAESYCESVTEREVSICLSPEISTGFNGQLKKNKQELSQHKGPNLEKENSWHKDECNQLTRTEKLKYTNKCAKRPEWNINKPLRRYIPASEKYPKQLQKQREEKKVRRQMELLHLVERNNPGHLSLSQGGSPAHELHRERQPRSRRHLGRKEAEPLNMDAFIKERSVPSPVPAVRDGSQHTQTGTLHLASSYERENVISGSQTGDSSRVSEPSHFIPYVRTNEVYYLDPDAPLSRPSTQDLQYESAKSSDQDQQQLFDCDVRDPLLNPNLVKHRDRQQAILKGLSELRQGLLQKQKELESNLLPSASNPEEF